MQPIDRIPGLINKVADIVELVIVRMTLLALAALGAYSLLRGHLR